VMKPSGIFGQTIFDGEVLEDYSRALTDRYGSATRSLKIAVDCASGPGGMVTPSVLKAMGHHVIPVNAQVSWRFPARPPEPTSINLVDFAKMVPELGVDLAFAHDGDADRLVMLDAVGRVVPDSVVSILALRALDASRGIVVVSENTSTAVAEEAEKLGLRVIRSRVGKTFAVLEAEHGVFATEPSKIVDPQWGLWEDGINAAVMISNLISGDRGVLATVLQEVEWKYRQVNLGATVSMPVLVDRAMEVFKKFRVKEERKLDGLKIVLADGSWVMFRSSGTEPKVRLYCESKDQQQLEALIELGISCVESSK